MTELEVPPASIEALVTSRFYYPEKAVRAIAKPVVAAYLRGLAENLGDLRLGPEDLRLLADQADGGVS